MLVSFLINRGGFMKSTEVKKPGLEFSRILFLQKTIRSVEVYFNEIVVKFGTEEMAIDFTKNFLFALFEKINSDEKYYRVSSYSNIISRQDECVVVIRLPESLEGIKNIILRIHLTGTTSGWDKSHVVLPKKL